MDLTKIYKGMENGAEAIEGNFGKINTALTPVNDWQILSIAGNAATDAATPAKWRVRDGFIEFRGLVKTKSGNLENQIVIGPIPSGINIEANAAAAVTGDGNLAMGLAVVSGNLAVTKGSATQFGWCSLSGARLALA